MGLLWSYVKPLMQFLIYFVALGIFLNLQRGTPNYAIYLFAGIVLVNFFTESLGNATRSIVDNRDLIRKIYLPRELFPVATVWVSAAHFLPQLLVLIAACLVPRVGGADAVPRAAGGVGRWRLLIARSDRRSLARVWCWRRRSGSLVPWPKAGSPKRRCGHGSAWPHLPTEARRERAGLLLGPAWSSLAWLSPSAACSPRRSRVSCSDSRRPTPRLLLILALLGVVATACSGATSAMLQATGSFGRMSTLTLFNTGLTAILAMALALTVT